VKLSEQNFQTAVRIGGVALAVCAVANVYLVMRHVELYRDAVRRDQQAQQLIPQQQAMEGALRDFASRASADPQIAEILIRYKLVQTNAVSRTSP
jgi:hypothetical protein